MSLYFETKVQFYESGVITTACEWHPTLPFLAVGSYCQDKGGVITIFDEMGEPLPNISYPIRLVAQITSLVWHPEKKLLASGWENGEISIWNGAIATPTFVNLNGPHTSPVNLLTFSELGGRLVSGDATGILVGWKYDPVALYLTSFHHDLKDPITHITFRLSIQSKSSSELQSLARAAVNGDESALDALSTWRPRTNARTALAPRTKDNTCFYVCTQSGTLYYVNQSGTCTEITNLESSLNYLLYHPNKEELIIMTEGLTLEHYSVDPTGSLMELSRIKLSGKTQAVRGASSQGFVWVGGSSFAVLTGDMTIRILDLETGDNYLLPTDDNLTTSPSFRASTKTELFTSIAFCKFNRTLCAGTNLGQLHIWSYKNNKIYISVDNPEEIWTLDNVIFIKGVVKEIVWGNASMRNPFLCVNCVNNVYILKKRGLCSFYCDDLWAIQLSSTQLLFQNETSKATQLYDIQVSVLSLNSKYVVISNERKVVIYEVINVNKNLEFRPCGNFNCETDRLIIYEECVIILTPTSVQLRSFGGVVINTIANNESEGEAIGIELNDKYLCVFTINGYVKVYDITKLEPRLVSPSKYVGEDITDFGELISAKPNKLGTLVGMIVADSQLIPDGRLYVWNIEMDIVFSYDFMHEDSSDNVVNILDNLNSDGEIGNKTIPILMFWDTNDSRLMAVESRLCMADLPKDSSKDNGFSVIGNKQKEKEIRRDETCITCLFATDTGLKVMYRCFCPNFLIGMSAPHVILYGSRSIYKILLKPFIGLEDCDATVRKAVLDFAFYLCLGNMDLAFKSINLVQSHAIWENLARMCVKTFRLDVALVCLGHMKNARAARALRRAINDPMLEPEAKAAVLAAQLGLLSEAKALYEKCNRWDLLNKLYQAQGKYEEAIKVAEEEDRIHLKNTYYHYGKQQEKYGDIQKAIELFQKANCKNEIPKFLMEQPMVLQDFMDKTTDEDMLRWWAQYAESRGDVNRALDIYGRANDCVSQVRILCFLHMESKAAEVAIASNNKAACYELARHYELIENMEEAIQFFRRAQAFGMALRICREQNMDDHLWSIALAAGPLHKIEAAEYFESLGDMQKAVTLYHRAGLLRKALELAFSAQQYDILQEIAAGLDKTSDPELIAECAEYFTNNEQYEKAVDLLAVASKYHEALNICSEHTVNISEEMAEHLTPAKGTMEEEARVTILYKLAEILHAQGDYHLATKKFTQAGDKITAMKSLLKSGDTEKIIFFAGVSRQKEVYIMAANYLQALDWQNNPEILRNIVSFYAKGKAHDLLANFYVACAQVEIDEFKNYGKALSALGEAARCLAKVDHDPRAMESLAYRQSLVKRYLECQRTIEKDINSGIMQCRQLLRVNDSENPVRKFDVLYLMIEQGIHPEGDKSVAMEAIQELQRLQGDHVTRNIPREILEKLGIAEARQEQEENYEDEDEILEVI